MTRAVNISTLRADLPTAAAKAFYAQERTLVRRRGKDMCAIVTLSDLAVLEQLDETVEPQAPRRKR